MPFDLSTLPQAVGNSLSSAVTRIQEAATKAVSTFGGSGPFSKVAASASDLNSAAAKMSFRASEIKAQYTEGEAALAALEEESRSSVEAAYDLNAMSADEATKLFEDAAEADVTAKTMNQAKGKDPDAEDHYIQLEEKGASSMVRFVNMPDVTESRTVEYEAVQPPQSPGAFQKYKGTASVQWNVNATLTCRTTAEATKNLEYLNRLRGWTMPYFGENTRLSYPQKLGAPPPVLMLTGFREQMIGPVPVVITSLNWNFPQDVDYIPAEGAEVFDSANPDVTSSTGKLIPFPTVMKVSIQLVESFSTDEFNGFSLADFRVGQMNKAWTSRAGTRIGQGTMDGQAKNPEEAQGGGQGRGVRGGATAEELTAYAQQQQDAADRAIAQSNARDAVRGQLGYGVTVTERRGGTLNEYRNARATADAAISKIKGGT